MIDKLIVNKEDCAGCNACFNICPINCISMKEDGEGFLYPSVDYSLCIKCEKCINVCPVINIKITENSPIAYACINKDEEIRLNSSSGGIFTLTAEEVIAKNGVVFGAAFNEKFELNHIYVETSKDLDKLRGSKYVQSNMGSSYQQAKSFLDEGRKVLFSGTPCQISGLKYYLNKEYSNLITIDLICHGVPSPEVWKKYIDYRENKAGSTAQRISFRLKNEGWKRYSVFFLFKNNTEYLSNLQKDLFMRAFLKDVCLRPSCYDCKFKTLNRSSDITLADFWGVANILPEMDDDKGTSLIFVNSKVGADIFKTMKDKMISHKVDIQEAVKYNSAAVKSATLNPNRIGFMKDRNLIPFDLLVKKYCKESRRTLVKQKFKSCIKKILIKINLFDKVK